MKQIIESAYKPPSSPAISAFHACAREPVEEFSEAEKIKGCLSSASTDKKSLEFKSFQVRGT